MTYHGSDSPESAAEQGLPQNEPVQAIIQNSQPNVVDCSAAAACLPQAVVDRLQTGQSAVAVFDPGDRRSLYRELLSVMGDGLIVVMSSTRETAETQVQLLAREGVQAAYLPAMSSGPDRRTDVFRQMHDGTLRILFVTHSNLYDETVFTALRLVQVGLLVVEDAVSVSSHSPEFSALYRSAARLFFRVGPRCVLAVATNATCRVARDIAGEFTISPEGIVRVPWNPPNRILQATVARTARHEILVDQLRERPPGPTVCFVTDLELAQNVTERVSAAGLRTMCCHTYMRPEERTRAWQDFSEGEYDVLIATSTPETCVPPGNIRYVWNYTFPENAEEYGRQVGLASRDGEPAICELLVCRDEVGWIERGILSNMPTRAEVASEVNGFLGFPSLAFQWCNLMDYGASPLLKAILAQMENNGFLQPDPPFYAQYECRSTARLDVSRLSAAHAGLLEELFPTRRRIPRTVRPEDLARGRGIPREQIVELLVALQNHGFISLRGSQLSFPYTLLPGSENREALIDQVTEALCDAVVRRVEHLYQMYDFATGGGNIAEHLSRYFDE